LRVVRQVVGVVVRLPRAARGGDLRVGAAGRAAVVPDDQHVGAAVAVDHVQQAQPAGAAGHVVHAVTALELAAEGGAAGRVVDAVGALEVFAVLLDGRPQQAARVVVVQRRSHVGAGTVVVRRPPYLAGAGVGRRRGQRLAVGVGAALPRRRAEAVARDGAQGVVVVVDGQADLVQVVGALDAVGRRPHALDGGQQEADEDGDDGDDDEQLDQREAPALAHGFPPGGGSRASGRGALYPREYNGGGGGRQAPQGAGRKPRRREGRAARGEVRKASSSRARSGWRPRASRAAV